MPNLSFDVFWKDHGAQKGMRNLGDQTDKTRRNFGALKAGAVAGLALAGAAIVKFGASSVQAYKEAQASQLRLQDAFDKFPRLADTNIGALRKLNEELAKKTRFDDDATASGQAVLAQFKLTGTQITQLTPLLQDYAAKTGKDLPTAARDLGKAVLGQGRSLKAVGINFKDTGSQAGNLSQITKGLREQVGGFAEKEGKTAAGQAEILKNRWGELKEAAGGQLIPAVNGAVRVLGNFVGLLEDLGPAFSSFGRIAKSAVKTFIEPLAGGKASFEDFANVILTHQEGIVRAFATAGKVTVAFGIAIAQVASTGLKAFGVFYTVFTANAKIMIGSMGKILEAATWAFGWIPGLGPKLQAANSGFKRFSSTAFDSMDKAGKGIKGASGWIDNALIPSLKGAGRNIDSVARKEIIKAATRDSLRRTRGAVEDATKSIKENGKTLDVNSEKGRRNRASLKNLAEANRDYIRKLEQNGASTRKVDRATDNARATFIKTARSMGASERQAKDLANKFGLLDRRIDTISNRHVKIKFSTQSFSIGGVKYKVNTTSPSAVGRSGSRAEVAGHPGTQLIPPRDGGGGSGPFVDVGVAKMPRNTLTQPSVINRWTKQYADEGGKLLAKAVAKKIEESFVGVGGNGGLGPQGKGMAAAIRAGRRLGANSIGTYPGHHPSMAKARDFMISSRGEGNNIAAHMRSNARQYGIWYVIWNRRIASRTYAGMPWRAYTRSNPHTDHVHVSWYDRGGMLKPGGAGVNASGQPERVLSPAQTKNFDHLVKVMDRNQGAVNVHNHYHFDKYIGSKDELIQFLSTAKRQGRLDVILR